MYGDSHYELLAASSTGASADTAHSLYAAYDGLSDLNQDDIIDLWLEIESNNNGAVFSMTEESSATMGFTVEPQNAYTKFPSMRVGDASRIHFHNKDNGQNSEVEWVIWRRIG